MPYIKKEAVKSEDESIKFFSEVDLNATDKSRGIASSWPAWYFETQFENLKQSIEEEERELASETFPKQSIPIKKAKIKKMKERYDAIMEAKENLRVSDDKIARAVEELGPQLRDIMPTRSDDQKGLTDPHQIAKNWSTPCIKVSSEVAQMARVNGMHVSQNKINEIDAGKLWKIGRAKLGETTNLERLRRD